MNRKSRELGMGSCGRPDSSLQRQNQGPSLRRGRGRVGGRELKQLGERPGKQGASYPGPVLDLVDPQLHGHVEAVQDVPAEHQRVHGCINCMDPA